MPNLLLKTSELSASLDAKQTEQRPIRNPQANSQPSTLLRDKVSEEPQQNVGDTNSAPIVDAPDSTTNDGWIKLKAPRLDQQDATASGGDVDSSNVQAGSEAPVEGVASSTGTPPDNFPGNAAPDSFLVQWWPFLLFALILFFMVFSRLLSKREPSFKHQPISDNKQPPTENVRGQFKKSERFLKPKNKEQATKQLATIVEDETPNEIRDELLEGVAVKRQLAEPKGRTANIQQAENMQTDQPGDEEFDFDLNEEGADSDVFSFDDASEMDKAVDDKLKGSPSKRFKTEADVDASGMKVDELEIDDDEFGFDDEDSQLSLADSDAEFGFDLDDEEPNKFLDSGNLAAEAPGTLQTDDSGKLGFDKVSGDANFDESTLAGARETDPEVVNRAGFEAESKTDFGMTDTATAAVAVGAAGAAKKAGFFSKMFGKKNKKNAPVEPTEDSLELDEVAAASSSEATSEAVNHVERIADGSGAIEASGASLNDGDSEVDELSSVESLDDSDDFDFDLEIDDDTEEPSAEAAPSDDVIETDSDLSSSEDSDELMFDFDDEDDLGISDADLAETTASTDTIDPATDNLENEAEIRKPFNSVNELDSVSSGALDLSDSDDSDESFDLDDEDDLLVSDVDLAGGSALIDLVDQATDDLNDLENEAEISKPFASVEELDSISSEALDLSSSDGSGELGFDLDDEDNLSTSDADLAEGSALTGLVGQATNNLNESENEAEISKPFASADELDSVPSEGLDLSDSDGAGELGFELDDEDDLSASDADLAEATALAGPMDEAAELEDEAEASESLVSDDEQDLKIDWGTDQAEAPVVGADMTNNSAEEPSTSPASPEPEEIAQGEVAKASDDFGFGVFESEPSESVAVESADVESESNITVPIAAAATAIGAGIAGIAIAGSGSTDRSDSGSDKKLQAKLTTLETKNQDLSAQLNTLKQKLEDAAKKNDQSETLQTQLDKSQQQQNELTKTVDALTSERDQLLEEKDKWSNEAEQRSKEKDSIESEKKDLEKELSTAKDQLSDWEQEKADLVKQKGELESALEEQQGSSTELESLKAKIAAFSDERSSFESEIKTLEAKLAEAEAKPETAESDSSEDIEDLRKRFKLRLAAEHRKRKEAQHQVDEAEAQRNEVAKLLREAKAEILELKAQSDDDDFELAD